MKGSREEHVLGFVFDAQFYGQGRSHVDSVHLASVWQSDNTWLAVRLVEDARGGRYKCVGFKYNFVVTVVGFVMLLSSTLLTCRYRGSD